MIKYLEDNLAWFTQKTEESKFAKSYPPINNRDRVPTMYTQETKCSCIAKLKLTASCVPVAASYA